MDTVETWDWNQVCDEIKKTCPLIFSILLGAMTTRETEKDLVTRTHKDIRPILATVTGLLAYARKPGRMKAIQQIVGLQFFFGGLKREVKYILFNK